MSAHDTSHGNAGKRRTARAPLPVRILLTALAALALAVTGVAAVNLVAVSKFNQATASLNANIEAANRDDADWDAINATQQQTDAQFDDAGAWGFLLMPQVRSALKTNAKVSSTFTKRTRQEVAKTGGNTSDRQAKAAQQDSGQDGTKQGGGLTAQQRKQVEDLLKANQQSTPSTGDSSSTGKNDDADQSGTITTNETVKPW